MSELLEIEEISIYIQREAEKVNKIALFQPLKKRGSAHKPPFGRYKQKKITDHLALKTQVFLFKNFPFILPKNRQSLEAKFKTVIAWLLKDESACCFFFENEKHKKNFFNALQKAAHLYGYHEFKAPPLSVSNIEAVHSLTQIEGQPHSLMESANDFRLQMALLENEERQEILLYLVNFLERPHVSSVVDITTQEGKTSISLETDYASYKILQLDLLEGKILYQYSANKVASLDAGGACNQRYVFDQKSQKKIGGYSGSLNTPHHVMEQILLLLQLKSGSLEIVENVPEGFDIQEIKILFTSLHSWTELNDILDEQEGVRFWDQKILKAEGKYMKLSLLYINVAFHNYPTPAEIGAKLNDINHEALIVLLSESIKAHNMELFDLEKLYTQLLELKSQRGDYLKKEARRLELLDAFERLLPEIKESLGLLPKTHQNQPLLELLSTKNYKGIDLLLCLTAVAEQMGYLHNKNSRGATNRILGAEAADKAEYAFHIITGHFFIPSFSTLDEQSLFKVLYSLYFLWEEQQVRHWLVFKEKAIHQNSESTKYLASWIYKK